MTKYCESADVGDMSECSLVWLAGSSAPSVHSWLEMQPMAEPINDHPHAASSMLSGMTAVKVPACLSLHTHTLLPVLIYDSIQACGANGLQGCNRHSLVDLVI